MTSPSTTLTISERVLVSSTVWVRSLPEAEQGPSRRIIEDVEPLTEKEGHLFRLIDVSSRTEFIAALQEIAARAREGERPILHIDAHGHADNGILLAPSGEWVAWEEVSNLLRAINVATHNNLVCVLGLCYGLHLYKTLSIALPVPAYLFIAPEKTVSVGALEDLIFAFYRELHSSGDVTTAFSNHLSGAMESFHCQGLFLRVLATYIKTHCRGPRWAERTNGLAAALVERRAQIGNRKQRRGARATARIGVRAGPHLLRKFAPTFLIGRRAAFTYGIVERLAQARH